MTQEMLHHIAQQVMGPLQWLTEDDEQQVMDVVHRLLWERRQERDIAPRG
jgi:hypothetical protein